MLSAQRLPGILFALAAGLMWGLVFVVPLLLPEYPATLQSFGRYLAFGLIALPLAWFDRAKLRQLSRADWLEELKLALVDNVVYCLFLASAIQRAGTERAIKAMDEIDKSMAGKNMSNSGKKHQTKATAAEPTPADPTQDETARCEPAVQDQLTDEPIAGQQAIAPTKPKKAKKAKKAKKPRVSSTDCEARVMKIVGADPNLSYSSPCELLTVLDRVVHGAPGSVGGG